MARFESVRKRVEATREEIKPMLRWVARKARERVQRGRIALLENPHTSRAYQLEFFEALEGVEDGLLAGTTSPTGLGECVWVCLSHDEGCLVS